MLAVKPHRRDVTNSQWTTHTQQMSRIEEGLNRLLDNAGLQQTGKNKNTV